jgi:hypothetical protein
VAISATIAGLLLLLCQAIPEHRTPERRDRDFKIAFGTILIISIFAGSWLSFTERLAMVANRITDGTAASYAAYLITAALSSYTLLMGKPPETRLAEGAPPPRKGLETIVTIICILDLAACVTAILWLWRDGATPTTVAVALADGLAFCCAATNNSGGPGKFLRAARNWAKSLLPKAAAQLRLVIAPSR